jgi:parallel beta-helix repeat protein
LGEPSSVIIDISLDIIPTAKGATLYVNMTGSGGAYTNIQDAINAANPGDTVFVYNGTYESVGANKQINLIGEDMNSTIIDGGGTSRVLWISADYVNVTGFTITNSGPNVDDEGIFIISDHNTITGNRVVSNRWYGIEILISSYNIISSNIISSNEKKGINLKDSHRNIITGNEITNNDLDGIYLELSSNNTIHNNNISSNLRQGIWAYQSNNNNISSNRIQFNRGIGILLGESEFINITDNTMIEDGIKIGGPIRSWDSHRIGTSNTVCGKPVYYWKNEKNNVIPPGAGEVILVNCTNITIENQDLSHGSIGIEIGFSSNISILNNNITFNDDDGIWLVVSNNNTIMGNTVKKCDFAIILSSSDENNITNNILSNNYYGVVAFSSSKNSINYNTLLSNTIYGIHNTYNDEYSPISYNIITNSEYGIYIRSSSNNTINYNTLWNNDLGFRIIDSNNLVFYHNTIINNTNQALDDSNNANQWDNGYPSGGNYWSDYNGEDIYRGINQDIPGGDGIGDTNYSIDPDSFDNYPLMDPIFNYTILYFGWNLISVPYIQSDTNIEEVLTSITGFYDGVQYFSTTDVEDHWKHYHVSKPSLFDDLTHISHSIGFWIHITEPGGILFELKGAPPSSNQTIQLYKGWNMVGYPSLSTHNRTIGLNNLTFDTHVDCIQWFDASTKTWHFMDQDDNFVPGRGYWVHSKVEIEWEVPL